MSSFDFMADEAYVTRLRNTGNNSYYKLMAEMAGDRFLDDRERNQVKSDDKWNKPFALSGQDKVYEPGFDVQALPPFSVAVTLRLKLTTPLLTADDTPFYLFDNPVRRDHIFQQPYLSAAALLGLAQDAFRRAYPAGVEVGESTTVYRDRVVQAERLFGIAPDGADSEVLAKRGALQFTPAWFRRVSYEVMNPRDEKTGQGTLPIRFEAIEQGQTTEISFLYAPRVLEADIAFEQVAEDVALLMRALAAYWPALGLGAKRLAGYGHFEVLSATFKGKHWALYCEAENLDDGQENGALPSKPEAPECLGDFLGEDGALISESALQQRLNRVKKQENPEIERIKAEEARLKQDKSLSGKEKKAKLKALKDARKKLSKGLDSGGSTQVEAQRQAMQKQYNQCKRYFEDLNAYQAAQAAKIERKNAYKQSKTSRPLEKTFEGQQSWHELADWLGAQYQRGQKG